MSNKFKISAIVPTKNRSYDLLKLIDSLIIQNFLPYELIIVDQSDQSNFRKIKNKLASIKISLNYLHRTDISSLVEAKSFSVSVAKGNYICFLEDDIVLDDNFFAALIEGFKHEKKMMGCCGRITNMPRSSNLFVFFQSLFFKGIFNDPRLKIFNNKKPLFLIQCDAMCGGITMWKKSVFEREQIDIVNGFFMMEDVEYSTRIAKIFPGSLFVNYKATVIHKMSPINRLEFDLRQANKIKEAILFYKKRKKWKGATYGIFLVLVWWTLDAIFESIKRLTLKPITEHIKGLIIGFKTKLIPTNTIKD